MKEFAVGTQRPRFLMPTDKVKLLRTSTEGDVKPPGAGYPGPLADSIEQDDGATDGKPKGVCDSERRATRSGTPKGRGPMQNHQVSHY